MFFNFNPYRFGITDNLMWSPVAKFSKSSATLSSETAFAGLEGDTYDYRIFIDQDSARVNINQNIDMQFNNDTSSNYKRLISRGTGSVASGHSITSTSLPNMSSVYTTGDSAGSVLEITGATGTKRSIIGQNGFNLSGSTYLDVINATWNNTANELTSIQLVGDNGNYTFDAYLFRRKKDSLADDGLEQVGIIDLAGKTTADFTGLDGDNDGEYILELQGYVDDGTTGTFTLTFNNDSGANYSRQYLKNTGTLTSVSDTINGVTISANSSIQQNAKFHIMGKTVLQTVTGTYQFNAGCTWNNTVNDITSINCTFPAGATGQIKLYKRASKESELVTREAIDGALFHTWSSLDSSNCIYRIKANLTDKGTNAGILSLQINGDTANNYTRQQLHATTTNEGSANITADYVFLGQDDNEKPATVEAYIFPKVGSKRTILVKTYYNSPTAPYLLWHYTTWNNTVDAITSLKIFAGANPVIGEISLEKIDVMIPAVAPLWSANDAILRAINPTAYWKGENLLDSCGTHNLTNFNGTTFTPGKNGNAFTFDGVNQKVVATNHSDFDPESGDYTMAAWIKITNYDEYPCVMSKVQVSGSYAGWYWNISSSGKLTFTTNNNTIILASAATINLNTDYLIVLTIKNDVLTFYINGVFDSSVALTSVQSYDIEFRMAEFVADFYLSGQIDEAFIKKGVGITSAQVTALYNSGTGSFLI